MKFLIVVTPPSIYHSGTAFVFPPNPGLSAQVPSWTPSTEKKRITRDHVKQRRLYDKYRTVDSALKNQLLTDFDNPYLATLKNESTGYTTRSTMDLLNHLYQHCAHISSTNMAENDKRVRASYNAEEPLGILI